MKTYFVSHVRCHGFWIVMENNAGHYRQVSRFSNQRAAANAAAALNAQQRSSEETMEWAVVL